MSDESKPEDEVLDLEVEDEDEGATSEDSEEKAPPSLKDKLAAKKGLIIGILVVLLVAGGIGGLYFMGILTAKKPHEISLSLPGQPVFHEIQKITVDLKPSPKHARPFIRLVMQVELQGESAKTAFIDREAKILDSIQSHLRTLTVDELHDKEGTELLRADLVSITNNIIKPERAITYFYKEIMIR